MFHKSYTDSEFLQAAGRPSAGEDEAELSGVQGGDLCGASQPAGGSPPARSASSRWEGTTLKFTGLTPAGPSHVCRMEAGLM